MSEDMRCSFYNSSTAVDGSKENPKVCGKCDGYYFHCPMYIPRDNTDEFLDKRQEELVAADIIGGKDEIYGLARMFTLASELEDYMK